MKQIPFIHGLAPMQLIVELGLLLGLSTLVSYSLERMGIRLNKLFQAAVVFLGLVLYFTYRVVPPFPFSMLATCAAAAAIGIFGWVSSNETYWQNFRRPILAVLDGTTRSARLIRGLAVLTLPIMVGLAAFVSMQPPDPDENKPIELRAAYPAPPAKIIVYSPEDFKK